MRSLLLISLFSISWLLASPAARAQWLPADDFFNDGAHSYLSNNIPQALRSVETGLKVYPHDEKLQKLYELLKQQQQQQQQQQQNQQNQNQQNQQKQNNQNSQSQSSSNQQKQGQQKQNQQKQNSQSQQQNQPSANQQNGQKPEGKNGGEQKMNAAQMTPEEAKRLLDAQKDNEQMLIMHPNGKPQDTTHPIKDW